MRARSDTTIVITQRERFAPTRESLERLFEATADPFDLVYVDAGSPSYVRDYLQSQARVRGFKLVRTDGYLTPNQARNAGFREVGTDNVVFIDNDLFVDPGWLGKLEVCLSETDATIVGPLYLETRGARTVIHMAGGEMWVTEEGGQRVFHERHRDPHRDLNEVGDLHRQQIDFLEFHCMLMRSDFLREVGGLDEELRSLHEHIDVCLQAHELGATVWLEPGARVSYTLPERFDGSDRKFWRWRWSESANTSSLRHFHDKWGFSDVGSTAAAFARDQRLEAYRPFLKRVTRWFGSRAGRPAERLLKLIEPAIDRRIHK